MERFLKDEIYKILFENSNDAIMLTNPNGKVYRANAAACEMFQRSEDELREIGRSGVVDLYDPRLEEALCKRDAEGRIRAEINFKRKDGTIFPTDCVSTIFKDAEDRIWTVIIVRDITEFKQTEATLRSAQIEAEHYATYDFMTGILNRRAFLNKLQQELSRSQRDNLPLSLIVLDIDLFKKINDTMGHSCGDKVLKNISNLITEKLRPYDMLGRYGGDEFIVYMPNTNCENVYNIAERLRDNIEKADMLYENTHFQVTISAGLICCEDTVNHNVDSLILNADKNLYLAKKQRNKVVGSICK